MGTDEAVQVHRPGTVAVVQEGAGSGIVTPEGVRLAFSTAGVASRSAALVVDLFCRAIALYILFVLLGIAAIGGGDLVVAIGGVIGIFVVFFGYSTAMETFNRGRTLGKVALGLQVVTVEGAPVRFRHAAIRSALELVDFFLSFGAVAMITSMVNPRHQRLGDMVAGTMVVRTRSAMSVSTNYTFVPPPGWESFASTLDVSRMNRDQHGVVRSFLLRLHGMSREAGLAVARPLAASCAATLGVDVGPHTSPVDFLITVTAAHQRAQSAAVVPDGRLHVAGRYPVLPPPDLAPTWGRSAPVP